MVGQTSLLQSPHGLVYPGVTKRGCVCVFQVPGAGAPTSVDAAGPASTNSGLGGTTSSTQNSQPSGNDDRLLLLVTDREFP